jgi:lipoate---protein ligase
MMFHLLQLQDTPILEQLRLEEALLRADNRNWILINRGTPPAIVMGISGKPENLLHFQPFPLIRRFSGGGTVVVDEQTLFITLLGNKSALPCQPFPEKLMRWTDRFYSPLGISLRDNDYVIGDRKCGGNAQYIQKDRWLHHTSFLWDYSPDRLSCLKIPQKQPSYREGRSHTDFLTPLCSHFETPDHFLDQLITQLSHHLPLHETTLATAKSVLAQPHRKATLVSTLVSGMKT